MAVDNGELDPLQVREAVRLGEESRVSALGPLCDLLEEFYVDIPASDGYQLRAKICRQKHRAAVTGRPIILLFYGGGYMGGSCEQCTLQARVFATEYDAVIVSASYRLLPEHKMPRSTLDGLDTAKWVADNAEHELAADPGSGFVVGGYSAGGHLASIVASKAREMHFKYPVTGTFLCIPSLFRETAVPARYRYLWTSMEENTRPPAPLERVRLANSFKPGGMLSSLESPVDSPVGLQHLPPTWIQVGALDIFRDDGVIYAKLLEEAGVPTRFVCYPDLGHEAWTIWADESTRSGQKRREDAMDAMRWLLKR